MRLELYPLTAYGAYLCFKYWQLHSRKKKNKEHKQRQKHLNGIVENAITRVLAGIEMTEPKIYSHSFYGATGINPKHLVIWYLFSTDADLLEAQREKLTTRIDLITRKELSINGYPEEFVREIAICFTTDEDIQRTANGNYRNYFQ